MDKDKDQKSGKNRHSSDGSNSPDEPVVCFPTAEYRSRADRLRASPKKIRKLSVDDSEGGSTRAKSPSSTRSVSPRLKPSTSGARLSRESSPGSLRPVALKHKSPSRDPSDPTSQDRKQTSPDSLGASPIKIKKLAEKAQASCSLEQAPQSPVKGAQASCSLERTPPQSSTGATYTSKLLLGSGKSIPAESCSPAHFLYESPESVKGVSPSLPLLSSPETNEPGMPSSSPLSEMSKSPEFIKTACPITEMEFIYPPLSDEAMPLPQMPENSGIISSACRDVPEKLPEPIIASPEPHENVASNVSLGGSTRKSRIYPSLPERIGETSGTYTERVVPPAPRRSRKRSISECEDSNVTESCSSDRKVTESAQYSVEISEASKESLRESSRPATAPTPYLLLSQISIIVSPASDSPEEDSQSVVELESPEGSESPQSTTAGASTETTEVSTSATCDSSKESGSRNVSGLSSHSLGDVIVSPSGSSGIPVTKADSPTEDTKLPLKSQIESPTEFPESDAINLPIQNPLQPVSVESSTLLPDTETENPAVDLGSENLPSALSPPVDTTVDSAALVSDASETEKSAVDSDSANLPPTVGSPVDASVGSPTFLPSTSGMGQPATDSDTETLPPNLGSPTASGSRSGIHSPVVPDLSSSSAFSIDSQFSPPTLGSSGVGSSILSPEPSYIASLTVNSADVESRHSECSGVPSIILSPDEPVAPRAVDIVPENLPYDLELPRMEPSAPSLDAPLEPTSMETADTLNFPSTSGTTSSGPSHEVSSAMALADPSVEVCSMECSDTPVTVSSAMDVAVTSVSSSAMECASPVVSSAMDIASPSAVSSAMDIASPSAVSSAMDIASPSPVSSAMDIASPSAVSSAMDIVNSTAVASPDMDCGDESIVSSAVNYTDPSIMVHIPMNGSGPIVSSALMSPDASGVASSTLSPSASPMEQQSSGTRGVASSSQDVPMRDPTDSNSAAPSPDTSGIVVSDTSAKESQPQPSTSSTPNQPEMSEFAKKHSVLVRILNSPCTSPPPDPSVLLSPTLPQASGSPRKFPRIGPSPTLQSLTTSESSTSLCDSQFSPEGESATSVEPESSASSRASMLGSSPPSSSISPLNHSSASSGRISGPSVDATRASSLDSADAPSPEQSGLGPSNESIESTSESTPPDSGSAATPSSDLEQESDESLAAAVQSETISSSAQMMTSASSDESQQ